MFHSECNHLFIIIIIISTIIKPRHIKKNDELQRKKKAKTWHLDEFILLLVVAPTVSSNYRVTALHKLTRAQNQKLKAETI